MKLLSIIFLITFLFISCKDGLDFNIEDCDDNVYTKYEVYGTSRDFSISYASSDGRIITLDNPKLPFIFKMEKINFFYLSLENSDVIGSFSLCIDNICVLSNRGIPALTIVPNDNLPK